MNVSSAAISFPFLGDRSICPPNSFTLFGHTFYWYGVIIACGFLLAVTYCWKRCGEYGISQNDLTDVLLFGVPLGIVGARIYYVVFYGGYHSLRDIIAVWEGGLAIYGGVIAAVITIFVVCRVKKISAPAVLDVIGFGLLIGQLVGRWGNFMNREAFGAETAIFCRMGLTLDGTTIYVHPTFLYESLWNLIGFIALHIFSKKVPRRFDGEHFLMYLAWYGLGRSWIEGLRTDSLYLGSTGIRVSQLLAIVLFVCCTAALIILLRSKKLTPDRLWVNRSAALTESASAPDEAEASGPEAADSPEDDLVPDDTPPEEKEDTEHV